MVAALGSLGLIALVSPILTYLEREQIGQGEFGKEM